MRLVVTGVAMAVTEVADALAKTSSTDHWARRTTQEQLHSYLTECIYESVLESQLPPKTVYSIF